MAKDLALSEFWDLHFSNNSMLTLNVWDKCKWDFRRLEAVVEATGGFNEDKYGF